MSSSGVIDSFVLRCTSHEAPPFASRLLGVLFPSDFPSPFRRTTSYYWFDVVVRASRSLRNAIEEGWTMRKNESSLKQRRNNQRTKSQPRRWIREALGETCCLNSLDCLQHGTLFTTTSTSFGIVVVSWFWGCCLLSKNVLSSGDKNDPSCWILKNKKHIRSKWSEVKC